MKAKRKDSKKITVAPSNTAAKSEAEIWDAESERQWFTDKKAGGAAWAQKFFELYRAKPEGYDLQVWIDDAERLFEGNHGELNAFYETLQAAVVNEASATPEAPRTALEIADEINTKLVQASAIFSLIGIVPHSSDEIPDTALPNAAWAGSDLLEQADALVGKLHALAKAAREVAHV